jgi:DNA-binding NarL/FixJ family response regulator
LERCVSQSKLGYVVGCRSKGAFVIDVIIIDDHPIVRAGMRSVLEITPDIQVIAEGDGGVEALRLVAELQPDVLVLDLNLPDINGADVARKLKQEDVSAAILVLTAHNDRQTVFGLLECGAIGYVLKDEALETLANAVRAAARGESWLSPSVATQVVQAALEQTSNDDVQGEHSPITSDEDVGLTSREREVLSLLARGLDNTSIAQELVVTKRTVQNHVSNIYGKLGVDTRTEAMLYAIRKGWVEINDMGKPRHGD